TRGSSLPCDEATHRLLHVALHKFRSSLLGIAADFADHDHSFRLGIAIEQVERIQEVGANNRIAADPNRGRLTDAALRKLMHRLISERPRARHDADRPLFVNRSRHNADLAFAWR